MGQRAKRHFPPVAVFNGVAYSTQSIALVPDLDQDCLMSAAPPPAEKSYTIEAVDCAVDVMLAVAAEPDLGGSEIARRLGGSKQRIFRMLKTLEARRIITRDPGGKGYRLGFVALSLGSAARNQIDLVRIAEPLMQELGNFARETVQMRILDGLQTLCVSKWEPERDLRVNVVVGGRRPLYAGTGKMILAYLSRHVQDHVIATGLTPITNRTITSPEALRARLQQIRSDGYCISRGEVSDDLIAISAPVFQFDGTIAAAVNVTAPAERMPEERVQALLPMIQDMARRISRALGYTPSL